MGIPVSDLPHGAAFWLPVVFTFGAMVGSFLNVAIYRIPIMQARFDRGITEPPFNLAVPRSRCPCCGHQIAAWENIPIISWLALRGRCSACRASIHWRYPAVELLIAILFVLIVLLCDMSWLALASMTATASATTMIGLWRPDGAPTAPSSFSDSEGAP